MLRTKALSKVNTELDTSKRGADMNNKQFDSPSGLQELLGLFGDAVTVSDVIASNVLGRISASIAKKRLQSNMTQKEFASYMCVSQGMVSRWEGGDYNFSIRTLADIAEKLNMELTVNLDSEKRDIQVKHIQNIVYIESGNKEFTGKISKADKHEPKFKLAGNRNECQIYNFCERLEM